MPPPGDPLHVLVVDDDPDTIVFVEFVLRGPELDVVCVNDPHDALKLLDRGRCDVVVTDVEMPQMTGLELIGEIRRRRPRLPILVITAHPSVDYAVGALRNQADEFLGKPLDPAGLLSTVTRLGREGRSRTDAEHRVILAVGAHPDDVEIGVGGTLSVHHTRGDEIAVVTLTRGARGGSRADRMAESRGAAELVTAQLYLHDLDDTRVPVGDPTLSAIQQAIREVRPDTVYTHSIHDLHQDHRAVHQATLVAARRVPTVACYQSPSATVDFRPNRFVDIDGHSEAKLELLACFASQLSTREYLEPDLVLATARYWSRYGGGHFAEPLEVVRDQVDLTMPETTENSAALEVGSVR